MLWDSAADGDADGFINSDVRGTLLNYVVSIKNVLIKRMF